VRSVHFVFFSYASKATSKRLKVVGGGRERAGIGLGHDSMREDEKRLVDGRERERCALILPGCMNL
jgi:hypothetical protein